MGKKSANSGQAQQVQAIISKNHEKTLHSIKVLRPKVYITDSSSFKQLVQELTGYPSCTQPHQYQKQVDPPAVIEIEDHDGSDQIPTAATAISMDSSFEQCDVDQAFDQLEEINQANGLIMHAAAAGNCNDIMMMNSTTTFDQYGNGCLGKQSTVDDHWNWLAYQNIESWLLDGTDNDQLYDDQPYSHCYYNGFISSRSSDQEVSVFDYELGGLIG